ncbi:hypothetical protein Scep_016898 [Stephania cephalantha]|uniref:Uncharacterized protein n=1 Tax=Stephania cephalantha TaxID=152367 RepID=A0AAP0IP24_9MAGN
MSPQCQESHVGKVGSGIGVEKGPCHLVKLGFCHCKPSYSLTVASGYASTDESTNSDALSNPVLPDEGWIGNRLVTWPESGYTVPTLGTKIKLLDIKDDTVTPLCDAPGYPQMPLSSIPTSGFIAHPMPLSSFPTSGFIAHPSKILALNIEIVIISKKWWRPAVATAYGATTATAAAYGTTATAGAAARREQQQERPRQCGGSGS